MRTLRQPCRIHCSRRVHTIMWPILLLLVVGGALTSLLPSAEDNAIMGVLRHRDISVDSPAKEDLFTIVMQTYNRTDLLLKLLNHYQAAPHLHSIIIVWNNVAELPPRRLWDSLGPHPVPVFFKQQTTNLMRNRLQPFPEIETDAVLMLDDDILLGVPDVSFAFSVWKQFPERIVGFVPRKHVTTSSGVYSYGSFELQNPDMGGGDWYSMVLVGAAFYHRRFLQLFQEQPAAVHALVDATQNCDDIAMNFVVALDLARSGQPHARSSGVFIKPVILRNMEYDASSGYTGLWHRAEHLLQRSYCLNKLAQIYGGMPLRYSNLMISQFGFPNYGNQKSKV